MQAIKGEMEYDSEAHNETVILARTKAKTEQAKKNEAKYKNIFEMSDKCHQRIMERLNGNKVSSWLTVLPIARNHFDLTAQEFRDSLALRYKKPLLSLPDKCDGCGASFDVNHTLSCRRGGLIGQRHNEVRDAIGDLAALAWGKVSKEPVVQEAREGSDCLVADLRIWGVWFPQAEALFVIRVTDTDAQSYLNHTPKEVLETAEKEKKKKYSMACEKRRASFTPLCMELMDSWEVKLKFSLKDLMTI